MIQNTYSIQWHGDVVDKQVKREMNARVKLAALMLRDATVKNISKPVTKLVTRTARSSFRRVRVDPNSRSKPGEFPRADTTRLMKDIFWRSVAPMEAIVGTTLDYGLWLEIRLDRSFLRRTFKEQQNMVRRVLTNPIPGKS
jgi:hypothetical protein